MRNLIITVLLVAAFAACTTQKKIASVSIEDENIPQDSVKHELIVLDSGFESWLVSRAKPEWYYSQSYLESWNRQYVTAWNNKYRSNARNFGTYIDYSPAEDYGKELNYRLYNYFQYVEQELKIPILRPNLRPRN